MTGDSTGEKVKRQSPDHKLEAENEVQFPVTEHLCIVVGEKSGHRRTVITTQGSNRHLHNTGKISLSYSWEGIMQALP